jgi:hypothetical protein
LDKYLSKQQLKIVTVLKEFIGKNEGMFFSARLWEGKVCQQMCASASISKRHSLNKNAPTKKKKKKTEWPPPPLARGAPEIFSPLPLLYTPLITNICLLITSS